jgi:mono/diheme cytochrome c family protein
MSTKHAFVAGSGVLLGLGAVGFLAARTVLRVEPAAAQIDSIAREDALRQRGAYLMAAIGCQDCHSPRDQQGNFIPGAEFTGHPETAPLPEWDPSLLNRNILMTMAPTGTAFAAPWGVAVAPNLTPDKETGIGNLTAEGLIRSWRNNRHWKSPRPVLPPMPVNAFAALSDDDIRAIHAFLMSLPPVKNKAPDSIPAPAPQG